MLKDFVIAFGLALLWWFTGFPMSMPSGVVVRDSGTRREG
jgi:hypothetical protein